MILKLAFVEIVVDDFENMFTWYTKQLGFQLKGEMIANEDGRWCLLTTSRDDYRLALWGPSDPLRKPSPEGRTRPSFVPIFEVLNLPVFVKTLGATGVAILEPIRKRIGYCITTIADPEGNQLQLYETA